MNPVKKTIWILITFSLCIWITACKVVPASPESESPSILKIISNSISKTISTSKTFAAEEQSSFVYYPHPAEWYHVQPAAPSYIANLSSLACSWQGIAGQVFDLQGNPAPNITVVVKGKLNGQDFSSSGVTGVSKAYGPGGYEIDLSENPIASKGTLYIQLVDAQGAPLSDPFYFDTYTDCQKNLLIINFNKENPPTHWLIFPVIQKKAPAH